MELLKSALNNHASHIKGLLMRCLSVDLCMNWKVNVTNGQVGTVTSPVPELCPVAKGKHKRKLLQAIEQYQIAAEHEKRALPMLCP